MLKAFLQLIALFLKNSKVNDPDEITISQTNLNRFGIYLIYYKYQTLTYESHFYNSQATKTKVREHQTDFAKYSPQDIYQLKTKFINNEQHSREFTETLLKKIAILNHYRCTRKLFTP